MSINPTRITIYLAILIGLVFAAIISPIPVSAQEHTPWKTFTTADQRIQVSFDQFCTDNSLRESVTSRLEVTRQEILPGSSFIITSERIEGDWRLISVLSMDGTGCYMEGLGTSRCDGLLLAHKSTDGWGVEMAGTIGFSNLIAQTPDDILSSEAKSLLDPLAVRPLSFVETTYQFPWVTGEWQYWNGFPHSGCTNCIDLGTQGSQADRRVLVAADGFISNLRVCADTYVVKITDYSGQSLQYYHLDVSSKPSMVVDGARVRRGELLGKTKLGDFSDGACGTATQQDTSAHLHWANLPTDGTFVVDGWTLGTDSIWRMGGDARNPGQSPYDTLPSENYILLKQLKYHYVPFPTPNGGWPYLISTGDSRIRGVTIDQTNDVAFDQIACKAFWWPFAQGDHEIWVWYEAQRPGAPELEISPWPLGVIVPPVCAGEPGDTPPVLPQDDAAALTADLTLPDGSIVSPGQSLTKTWRLQNTGTTTWGDGYSLVFVDGEQMGAPALTTIPATAPYQAQDLSISLTAPTSTGMHTGYFQLRNPQGTYFGPRLSIKINVQTASSTITSFTADPPSPSEAAFIRFEAHVEGMSNFRAMRIKVDGETKYEIGAPLLVYDWQTSGYAAGAYNIVIEATDQTDTSWSHPEVRSMTYELTGTGGGNNHVPEHPTLISPYNWYVYYSGNTAQLCAQANGDPDGDAITAYYFEIYQSPELWNSGWSGSNCVTTAGLGPHDYRWHVKVRDEHGAESSWSDDWNFTLVNPNLQISELYFQPQDGDSEVVKIRTCTTGQGGIGITMRVSVNDANDGSDSGEWHIIKEQGSPCFNDIDAPIWRTLEYGDGVHRVRVEAHGLQTGWDGAAVRDEFYTLPHRRPNSVGLTAPIPASRNFDEAVYINSRSVTFAWQPTLRANNYTLSVGLTTNPGGESNPVFRQTFGAETTQYTVEFAEDYPALYWQVNTTNDKGSNGSGSQLIGIDQILPGCDIQPLPPEVYENNFQVIWGGTDNLAGIRTYDIQYQDSARGEWSDWLTAVPATKTYELFMGLPGHTYSFRCRATDRADNLGHYPDVGDTQTKIDPSSRPPEPWWDPGYGYKRNITIQNNMSGMELPVGYPVRVMFDSGTTPTAEEIYNASQSPSKCDDIRIVYNNTTEVNRVVRSCSPANIEIWYRTQSTVAAGGTSLLHQVYYGNPTPGPLLADPNQVWYPYWESGTTNLYYFQEGSGSITYDSSGNGKNCSLGPSTGWTNGKFGKGIQVFQQSSGGIRALLCGTVAPVSAFTVEFWINTSSDTDGRLVGALGGGGNGGPGNNWLVEYRGRIRLEVWPCSTCGSHGIESNFDLRQPQYRGHWNHVAIAFNGGNQVYFYINGNLDSIKTIPDQSGINTYAVPLEIGATESSGQINTLLGGLRIINSVKTSFPYGTYAQILNEPNATAGMLIPPPTAGEPDLAIRSFNAYPNTNGGLLVEALIQNLGTKSTTNGFYTDLYINHLPTGVGDYEGSISFWVNDPIPAGGSITLTTVLNDLGQTGLNSLAPREEITGTLFSQTDSTGALNDPERQGNISAGLDVCVAAPDAFENGDGDFTGANWITASQAHNFDRLSDEDWVKFEAIAGKDYWITTSALDSYADTYLYLYASDGVTLLAANDDYGTSLASRIVWTTPNTGTYYLKVQQWNPHRAGCGTSYTLLIVDKFIYLPAVSR